MLVKFTPIVEAFRGEHPAQTVTQIAERIETGKMKIELRTFGADAQVVRGLMKEGGQSASDRKECEKSSDSGVHKAIINGLQGKYRNNL